GPEQARAGRRGQALQFPTEVAGCVNPAPAPQGIGHPPIRSVPRRMPRQALRLRDPAVASDGTPACGAPVWDRFAAGQRYGQGAETRASFPNAFSYSVGIWLP